MDTPDRRVLFIGNVSSFLGNAIRSNLEEAGFEIAFCSPETDALNEARNKANILLVYLEENMEALSEALVYIKDLCAETEKMLFLIGYESEIRDAEKIIPPKELISDTFDRPLNVKTLVAGLEKAVEREENKPAKKHILVVDDSGTFLRTIKTWLDPYYKVSIVNSGMNAITFLAKVRPDLILLDYEMPVCDGPQVLGMIRDEPTTSDLPVMFLTGKGDRASVMSVVDLKPEGYILKTMKAGQILKTIADFFEREKAKVLK